MESNLLVILNKFNRVAIVGPLPPPLGGVSVHVFRLHNILPGSVVVPFTGGSVSEYVSLFLRLLFVRVDAIYLNVANAKIAFIMNIVLFFRGYKVFLMDHNDQLLEVGSCKKVIIKSFLNRLDCIFVVGPHILDKYLKMIDLKNKNIVVENAFIPPPRKDLDRILKTYPKEYFRFVESKKYIVNISAFKIKYENGIDLYGIDMAINALASLKEKGVKNPGLLIFIADSNEVSDEFVAIKNIIKIKCLEDDVLFVLGQKELWPSYRDSSVSIRATCRDGFGVTVAESIYMGCPVLASDVCERAGGAIIFRSRDQNDLNEKIFKLISKD